MRQIARIIIAAILLHGAVSAQQPRWDLSYGSVLERNGVANDAWVRTWLKNSKSPAAEWIAGWRGKPIISSILIEYPAFHAAERTTMWLVRTEHEAFYRDYVEGARYGENEEPISLKIYDDIYKQVTSWQQLAPRSAQELPDQALAGYLGFLSYKGPDGSKQMLLTLDDFVGCLDKECLPGKGTKSGRLMDALLPVLIPDAVRNYKHKTETEIARMTPEQRIDEEIRELDHLTDSADKQDELIRKYRVLDGAKGARRLIELMDAYEPKRLRDPAWKAALIATDIDENSVRLRASPEGWLIIDAVERLAARTRALGRDASNLETTLHSVKGVNFTDEAIRDTLWMLYKIKLSDAELLRFSNYLVKHHPDYPRWSKRYSARDGSKKNEAGVGTLVLIMKEPARHHQAYLAFKRVTSSRPLLEQTIKKRRRSAAGRS
ncbi:MAG TPA: hypothetical protein VMZ26_02245 [Pyrinomonadaceae bacterium]|nr:hypothetical protein [Pyrinomonadaceae bacterium]